MLLVKCVEKDDNLTVGKEYEVAHIELHKYEIVNDAGEAVYYEPSRFTTVKEDKVIYHGESDPLSFIDGKEYTVLGGQLGFISVVDETEEDFLYGSENFEEVAK